MIPIPDLSYFAVSGFISRLRQHYSEIWSSSLLLHDCEFDEWDIALSDQNPQLAWWLHNKTGLTHNIYLPYTPNIEFLRSNHVHIEEILKPAHDRIRAFLQELGAEDVDAYMADSNEWLSTLFCGKKQAHKAARIAARGFGIDLSELPAIILWASFDSSRVVIILPNKTDRNTYEYIKSIYWSIITSTENMASKHRLIKIDNLEKKIKEKLEKSHYIKNYQVKIRNIKTLSLVEPVYKTLTAAANEYSSSFEDSILNFEAKAQENFNHKSNFSVVKFAEASKSEIVQLLQREGFVKIREGGEHEIWQHPQSKGITPVPRHAKISPFVVKSIEKDIMAARKVS
ncbi:MAG: type II toxin-antitoxin system HicA family toxin [Pseudanabaenaceae cyanobacterium]|jgi:predicted RNA binding protein YcfA (HicA-like mRNA interferase family)